MSDDQAATFTEERQTAQELLDDDSVTAFYLGVIYDGETANTRFAQTADDPQQEGLQSLSLLATHLQIVANEIEAEPATVARDAATLADQMEELSPADLERTETAAEDAE